MKLWRFVESGTIEFEKAIKNEPFEETEKDTKSKDYLVKGIFLPNFEVEEE